ncbi:uncharacterized protein LOC119477398 isoform X2 [Sebastes umbrosus]|uniref:uncharacterized protein LOC119477398 isoform X2 n=1 Tax=Sebastes umbrosus TaxID=72105 RepID=UPI0018A049A4|nr:uncharacterized protein LOC119477398 isoform X2 [Sebastes umbrosus]
MTTATPNTTTVITQVRSLSFTMDLTFDSSYNNPNNIIYQDSFNSIERQSNTHISTFTAVASIRFRSGSTICDYAVSATSFQEMEIKALEAGIFTELSEKYPILFDSPTPLEFVPPQVLSGNRLTITCGPPPENLNFGDNFVAEWRRDNDLIRQDDQHVFSNGGQTLTVLNFFSTDNGGYECKLRRGDNSAFRQRFNGVFKLQERPLIQVSPVRQIVQCENGKEVPLTCSVNSPYEVEFKGTSTAGTGKIIHQFPIDCAKTEEIITCQVKNFRDFSRDITLALSTENSFRCDDPVFGVGNEGDEALAPCEVNEVGEKTVACEGDGEWREKRDDCVLEAVQKLLDQAKFLNNNSLPNFLSQLSNVTLNSTEDVVDSPATINAIVEILSTVANLSIPITRTSMEGFFILVFGTLLDKKVRSEITIKSLTGTTTSSTGISSSGGLAFLRNWRRDGYNVSSSATGLSQSFTDT